MTGFQAETGLYGVQMSGWAQFDRLFRLQCGRIGYSRLPQHMSDEGGDTGGIKVNAKDTEGASYFFANKGSSISIMAVVLFVGCGCRHGNGVAVAVENGLRPCHQRRRLE